MIETVFTAINGGRPNTDLSVMREDIEAALPAAINYAITGDYWANVQREDDRELPNSFVAEQYVSEVKCDNWGREYIDFDISFINVPGNSGIRYVQDVVGNVYTPRAMGVSRKSYWDKATSYNTEHQYSNKKIMLFNRPELVQEFVVGYVADSGELGNDDELPIPAGSEPQVIDLLTNLFLNQRMQPKDYIVDGIDPVNTAR